jgi:hypothetical protein
MPSQASIDIVNALFAGKKDLSDYVDAQMKTLAMDKIGDMKKEVGATMFAPTPDEPEEVDQPEASIDQETQEEPSDETDNGED